MYASKSNLNFNQLLFKVKQSKDLRKVYQINYENIVVLGKKNPNVVSQIIIIMLIFGKISLITCEIPLL